MKNFKTWAIALMAVAVIASCKKEDNTEDPTPTPTPTTPTTIDTTKLVRVGQGYITGAAAKAVVYAEKSLFVGYNKLYIAMYDSASATLLTDGHLELLQPMMDMGSMQHSAPVEFSNDINATTKLWEGAVVFSMSSMGMGGWSLNMGFHNHKVDKEGEGSISITVSNPAVAVMKSFIVAADDSTKILMSLLQPMSPQIGLNDFEITLHKMQDMMTFPAVNDYTVQIEPEMPSMGHGSPNNVNPVFTANGHYAGKVNFTMTGFWRVHVKLYKNGVLLDDKQYFDITF
jgi:hypothetical protein